jgi:hypothetical protein
MQILFAAPLILAAGIVFTVLSLIPRARRWAIPIPCGILGSGAFACLAIFVGIVVTQFIESPTPTRYPLLAFYWAAAISGLAGGVAVGAAARWVAAILPAVLLRLAVFFAAWCSYFVLMAGLLIFVNARFSGPIVRSSITAIGLELLLSLTGAWFIARRSEGFAIAGCGCHSERRSVFAAAGGRPAQQVAIRTQVSGRSRRGASRTKCSRRKFLLRQTTNSSERADRFSGSDRPRCVRRS